MNRIDELIAESGVTVGDWDGDELNRLIESVVRECVSRLEYTTDEDGTFLLEHFGIEE